MRDGPSPRIFCLTPFARSVSSPTAAAARGARSPSSAAAPNPSANIDRRVMLAMIGLLLCRGHAPARLPLTPGAGLPPVHAGGPPAKPLMHRPHSLEKARWREV